MENYIFGLRPIIEAIKSGKNIDRLLLKHEIRGELTGELLELVKEQSIPIQRVPVERLNRITRQNHQGAVAYLSSVKYYNLDELLEQLSKKGRDAFLVILDGITDVRNFGAIARTCDCAGVDGIIIPAQGSAGVGPDAVKTSAGALLTLPVCKVSHILDAVRLLKDSGFSVVAASEKANETYTAVDYHGPVAIVMGNEEKGINPRVLKECSTPVSIPQYGNIQSLNVSVAAGVMIYEVIRQRNLNNTIISK